MTRRRARPRLGAPALAAGTVLISLGAVGAAVGQHGMPDARDPMRAPGRPLEEVLRAHTETLMAVPGVVGTAQGLCEGTPCIRVLVARKTPDLLRAIPTSLEGYPVTVEETGELRPFQPPRR